MSFGKNSSVVFVLFSSRWGFLYFHCPRSISKKLIFLLFLKSKFYLLFSILSASFRNPRKQDYCSILYVFSKTILNFHFLQFLYFLSLKTLVIKVCDYQQNVWHIFYAHKRISIFLHSWIDYTFLKDHHLIRPNHTLPRFCINWFFWSCSGLQ